MNKHITENRAIKNIAKELVQEALTKLDAADGNIINKEDLIAHLEKKKENLLLQASTNNTTQKTINEQQMKHIIYKLGNIVCENTSIILRNPTEDDREDFLNLQRDYSVLKSMLRYDTYCNIVWEEHIQDKSLMLSITRDGMYLGYCGIKNIAEHPWEIVIELSRDCTGQGIGSIVITTMLNVLKAKLNISKYRIRIDPTNYPSQKLFEKLGAIPNGISELWIHNEKALKKCEEENLQHIDDKMLTVAKKFNVEPRKLLSHVLEYMLVW